MSQKELTMVDKMLFLNEHKDLLQENILAKIGNMNVANLILNLLLNNKKLEETEEYQQLQAFINSQNKSDKPNIASVYDIISLLKFFITRVYSGNNVSLKMMKRISDYETSFKTYQENNQKEKVLSI